MRKGYEVHYRVLKKVFLTEKQYKDVDELTLIKEIAKHEGVKSNEIRIVLDSDRKTFREVRS